MYDMSENLNIAQIGHPILRQKTKTVAIENIKTENIQKTIDKMIKIMKNANGAGLAANQIFEKHRICVLEILNNNRYKYIGNIPLKVIINPVITVLDTKDTFNSYEGCLSVPNLRGKVKRFNSINVKYYDREANFIDENIKGLQAIVYQHEIDHLDGKLFTDKVYDNSTLVSFENYIKYYQEDYEKELEKFINASESKHIA